VLINRKNKLTLVARCQKIPDVYYAMQTGPLMIEKGQLVPDIKVLQEHSKVPKSFFSPHARTLLAESEQGELLAMVTSEATLPRVAEILQHQPEAFVVKKIKTALNLDGGASTGMLINFKDQPFYIQEKKPVKVLVLFGVK
jgi:exopolysaccharide biosynthesis protein